MSHRMSRPTAVWVAHFGCSPCCSLSVLYMPHNRPACRAGTGATPRVKNVRMPPDRTPA